MEKSKKSAILPAREEHTSRRHASVFLAFSQSVHFLSPSPSSSSAVGRPIAPFSLNAATVFLLCVTVLVTAACSSLPDVHRLILGTAEAGNGVVQTVSGNASLQMKEYPAPATTERGNADAALVGTNLEVVKAAGGSPPFSGNNATLLIDGDVTLAAMLDAIESAKDHINLETYIIRDDAMGQRFVDLLLRKRAEGVMVNLLYDSFGCADTPGEFFDRLRRGGVNALEYNPFCLGKVRGPGAFYHRSHRKLLIVDGAVAFTGGINIGNAYLRGRPVFDRSIPPTQSWRDTDVMVEGPAVAAFQELFLASWLDQAGASPPAAHYFPEPVMRGNQTVQVVGSRPGYKNRGTYVMYVSALSFARKSIHITQSYFVPDEQTIRALIDAAARGVDVRIILPRHTDHDILRQAGRWYYGRLLDAGVRIYEFDGAILHAKTAVVDGIWSTIGSTNLELWSLVTSDEVNAAVIGNDFGQDMEAAFFRDLAQSEEILPDKWKGRPVLDRAKEFFSNLFHYWL